MIHATAIVDKKARIHDGVSIGAYCVIGPNVELCSGVKLASHVVIDGFTTIGDNTEVFSFASLGSKPQDLKFAGESSTVVIGKNNQIREYVTIQPGTASGIMTTTVGDNCLLMVGAHVAHDCQVGNNVIMANHATLAGHVVVEDNVIIGGLAAIAQFVRLGKHSFVGGKVGVAKSLIPFGNASNDSGFLHGLNIVGMKRNGYSNQEISELQAAYQTLFDTAGTFNERLALLEQKFADNRAVLEVVEFLKNDNLKSICMPRNYNA